MWVLALYGVSVAVYLVLALRSPLPLLFPDEFRYLHLARSLADGEGFTWRGADISQPAALYVYFITPAWALLSSASDAYAATKVLGTLALCTQVVPVWLVGRELLGPRLGLLAAALTVGGTAMISTAETTTEALAMPLSTTALCLLVLTLRRPSRRLSLLALACVLLASWARIQVAVLIPAVAAILALDLLRVRSPERARAHAPALAAAALLTLAEVVVALAAPTLTGEYSGVFSFRPPITVIARKAGLQLAELAALSGVLPVLLAAAAATRPALWRDDRTGPLLLVFWVVAAVTVGETALFLSGDIATPWGIQRYVMYAAPIAFLLALVLGSDRHLVTGPMLLAAAGAALLLAARPEIRLMGAERAAWATAHRLHQLVGVDAGEALTLVGLTTVGLMALVRDRLPSGARAGAAVGAIVAVVLLVQDQAAWKQMTDTSRAFRSVMPDDLSWIDRHASGPVALLGVTQNAPQFDDLDVFNRKITQVYGPETGLPGRQPRGPICSFRIARATGRLELGEGCGPVPRRFLINDPSARMTFADEVASAREPTIGRVVEVAADSPPRVRSLVILACPRMTPTFFDATPEIRPASAPSTCRPAVTGNLWLGAAAEVEARYAGGRGDHVVTVAGRRRELPARVERRLRFPVAAGASTFAIQQSWTTTDGTPRLLALDLVEAGGRRTSLL